MRKITFIIGLILHLFLFHSTVLIAQNTDDVNFDWVTTSNFIITKMNFTDMKVDPFGNTFMVGDFTGDNAGHWELVSGMDTIELNSNGSNDGFIIKVDPNGDFLWAQSLGSNGMDFIKEILIDDSGDIYTIGHFDFTVDFDPGPDTFNLTSTTYWDAFIRKMDNDGNFIWAKNFGGEGWLHADKSMDIDDEGNIYIASNFVGEIDFDPGIGETIMTTTDWWSNQFVLKLDSVGEFEWVERLESIGCSANSMCLDEQSNIYTMGAFKDSVDFNPGIGEDVLVSNGEFDIYIQKLNSAGDFEWVRQIGSVGQEYALYIEAGNSGGFYMAGHYRDTLDLLINGAISSFPPYGSSDFFIAKIDSAGDFIWLKTFGGVKSDLLSDLAIDESDNLYLTGYFQETMDFDPNSGELLLESEGWSDNFVLKLDLNGDFIWVKQFGNEKGDDCFTVAVDSVENVYTTGRFLGEFDFDPNEGTIMDSTESFKFYIHKMKTCASFSSEVINSCGPYLSPDGLELYTISGTYVDTLSNTNGCDSIINMFVSIENIDTIVYVDGTTLAVSISGDEFQWGKCVNGFTPILGETNYNFTASINGVYAVEITQNGCVDTSMCQVVNSVGINENSPNSKIIMYPNPVKDILHLTFDENLSQIEVIIRDVLGRQCLAREYNDVSTGVIELQLPSGVYNLEVWSNGLRYFETKIVKI